MNGSVLPSRGRVTINQVAEAAGVSKASVSRYIGGDRQLLADATARRIERAIDQLDYRPNQMARGLKRGRTRLIGMLVADILNPYSVAVMHGVETACREHGYSLVVCNTDRDDEQERHHLAALQSYNVEGLIVNTLGHHPGELRALHRELPMGALYHHFGDKKGLLAAVVQQIDDEMNLRLGAILAAGEDLWSGFRAYNRAYLEMALEAEIQRIVLRDAPAILGSPSSEASQLRCLSSMTGQLRELMDSGRVRRTDAEALAWLLNGALVDAALRIANAEHPPESLARACQALDVLLDGLLME
ncbi:TPA: LacI family DNA-binding transcriptional regulator [Pseudomonas aeruginosa]|nr:LacI family DNA-binding transcriptional regulator [Pseudomonas aeruginosa]